jgi:formylglycine-generating enzyme required for sulfatase activity
MKHYILHGGCWYFYAEKCRVPNRTTLRKGSHGTVTGFRLIKTTKK